MSKEVPGPLLKPNQTNFPELQTSITKLNYITYGTATIAGYWWGERTQKNNIWDKFKVNSQNLIKGEMQSTKRFFVENLLLRPILTAPPLIFVALKWDEENFFKSTQASLNQLALEPNLDRDLAKYSSKIIAFDAFISGFKSVGTLGFCMSTLKLSVVLGPNSYKDILKFSTLTGVRAGLFAGLTLGAFQGHFANVFLTSAVQYREFKETAQPTPQIIAPQSTKAPEKDEIAR